MTGRPLIIGHRGASGRLPENTVAAFRGALSDGADGVELDVRLSADGRAVVIHDATLARTSGVRGRVSDLTAAELARFDVPALDDVLALTARSRAVVYVEIKGSGEGLEAAVAADVASIDLSLDPNLERLDLGDLLLDVLDGRHQCSLALTHQPVR